MTDDITIPLKAQKAAREAYVAYLHRDRSPDAWRTAVNLACIAMLRAWPMQVRIGTETTQVCYPAIIRVLSRHHPAPDKGAEHD